MKKILFILSFLCLLLSASSQDAIKKSFSTLTDAANKIKNLKAGMIVTVDSSSFGGGDFEVVAKGSYTVDSVIYFPTASASFLLKRKVDGSNNVYPLKWTGYGADTTVDALPYLKKLYKAVPDGAVIDLPQKLYVNMPAPSQSFIIDGTKNITIQGHNTIWKQDGFGRGIVVQGGWENVTDIDSISPPIKTGTPGYINQVLYVQDASGYNEGDVIKVISNDTIRNRRIDGIRQGEFAIVDSVNKALNYIVIQNTLYFNYTDSPRVAKMKEGRTRITGITFISKTRQNECIRALSAKNLTIDNCYFQESRGTAINLYSCYNVQIDDNKWGFVESNTGITPAVFGYAIADASSSMLNITNSNANNVRHLFTTSGRTITNGVYIEFQDYGETMYATVDGAIVNGARESSVDTHENGVFISLKNIMSVNPKKTGLQIRSAYTTVDGYDQIGGYAGIRVTTSDEFNAANHVIIRNANVRRTYDAAFYVTTFAPFDTLLTDISVENSYFSNTSTDSVNSTNAPVHIESASVRFKNVTVESNNRYSIFLKNSSLLSENNDFKINYTGTGSIVPFYLNNNSFINSLQDKVWALANTTAVKLAQSSANDGADTNKNKNKAFITKMGIKGTITGTPLVTTSFLSDYSYDYYTINDTNRVNNSWYLSTTARSIPVLLIDRITDDHIVYNLLTAGTRIRKFPAGMMYGQRLTLVNPNSTNDSLDIADSNRIKANYFLFQGAINFVWDGTLWRETSRTFNNYADSIPPVITATSASISSTSFGLSNSIFVKIDASGNNVTLSLPPAQNWKGKKIYATRIDSSNNIVIVRGNAGTQIISTLINDTIRDRRIIHTYLSDSIQAYKTNYLPFNTDSVITRTKQFADSSGYYGFNSKGDTLLVVKFYGSGGIQSTSGSFTSTLTNTTNIASSTFTSATYTRVGDVVTARITGALTPTASGTATVLDFTLPVNPGGTTQFYAGTIVFSDNAGGLGYLSGHVDVNSSSGTAHFISGSTTTSGNFTIIIQYIISHA